MRRSLEKEFPVKKKKRTINRSVCTTMTSVFKTSGRKRHFFHHMREPKPLGSDCLVTKIKKRQKKKNVENNLNRLTEIGLHILKF